MARIMKVDDHFFINMVTFFGLMIEDNSEFGRQIFMVLFDKAFFAPLQTLSEAKMNPARWAESFSRSVTSCCFAS